MLIQHATTTIRSQFCIHSRGCLHLFIYNTLHKLSHICWYNNQEHHSLHHHSWSKNIIMTSRFEIWNNVHQAMTPLVHWYAVLDNDVILDIQNKVIHEILHDRTCLIKWAPMHEQVTILQKLLSHIFEQYANIQDDGYMSDKDIEEYPETFMPRPRIMPTNVQGPVQLQ